MRVKTALINHSKITFGHTLPILQLQRIEW